MFCLCVQICLLYLMPPLFLSFVSFCSSLWISDVFFPPVWLSPDQLSLPCLVPFFIITTSLSRFFFISKRPIFSAFSLIHGAWEDCFWFFYIYIYIYIPSFSSNTFSLPFYILDSLPNDRCLCRVGIWVDEVMSGEVVLFTCILEAYGRLCVWTCPVTVFNTGIYYLFYLPIFNTTAYWPYCAFSVRCTGPFPTGTRDC